MDDSPEDPKIAGLPSIGNKSPGEIFMSIRKIAGSVLALLLIASNVQVLADPPDESGPNVVRFEGNFLDWKVDEKSGLSAVLGFDPREACGLNFDFDQVGIKDIDLPSAEERRALQFSGYVQAYVWEGLLPEPFLFFPNCAFFFASEPVAMGMVMVNGTDNDVFVFDYENTNRNAFGYNAHGKLYDYAGNARIFHLTHRANWDGNDDESFSEKVMIRLK